MTIALLPPARRLVGLLGLGLLLLAAPVPPQAEETPASPAEPLAEAASIRPFPFPELRDPAWVARLAEFGVDSSSEFRAGSAVAPSEAAAREQTAQRLFLAGSYHFAAEEFAEALQSYRNALGIAPDNPSILAATAEAELRLDDPTEAVALLDRALELRPGDADILHLRGTALDALGKRLEAIESFLRALEVAPNNKRVLESLGATYFSLMRVDEGIDAYKRLVAIEPSNLRGLFYLSFGHQVKNDIDTALYYIREAIDYYPGHAPLYEFQINMLVKAGRDADLVTAIREAILRVGDATPFLRQYNQFLVASLRDAALNRLYQRHQLPEMILAAFRYPPEDLAEARASSYARGVAEALLASYEDFATRHDAAWAPHYYHARLLEILGEDAEAAEALRRAAGRTARSVALHLHLGELLRGLGRYEEAEVAFLAARQADPFWGRPYLELGRLQRRTFRYEEARETLAQGVALAPNDVELALALAEADEILGEVERAVSVLNDALTRIAPDPRLYRALAQAFQLLDRADLARRNMQRAVEREPGNLDLLTDLLRLQLDTHDPEASATFAAALALDLAAAQPESLRRLAAMLVRHGDAERSLLLLERIATAAPARADLAYAFFVELAEQQRDRVLELGGAALGDRICRALAPDVLRLTAELRLEALLGDPAEAATRYRAGLAEGTILPTEGWYRLAATLEAGGDVDGALAALDEGAGALGGEQARFLRLRAVETLLRAGRSQAALDAVAALTGPQADDVTLLADLAGILQEGGLVDEAERLYRAALALAPDNPVVLNNLAYLYATHGRELEQARAMARRALEQLPEAGFVMDTLGWVHFRLGEHDQAIRYLEAALRLSEWDVELYDHLGDAHARLGQRDKARSYYRRALNLAPGDGAIAAKLEALK